MSDSGILPEDVRFELIRGAIIEMARPGSPHSGRVRRLDHLFHSRLADVVIVSVQAPVVLDRFSAPLPDLTLLKPQPDFYTKTDPTPQDALLVIEVSDTTIKYDTNIKAPLYAEAGIPEYWVLDVNKDLLVVRTDPAGSEYRHSEIMHRGQTIHLQKLPSVTFSIDEILD